jgi:ABC-type Fe3+ transport system substrate-binding protein
MPYSPPLNRFIFAFYFFLSASVFVFGLFSPEVRQFADAPGLQQLVTTDPIVLPLVYSTEKEAWLEAVRTDFENNDDYLVEGRPIVLEMEKAGSREMVLDVLDDLRNWEQDGTTTPPVLISPASSLQSAILEADSARIHGQPVVNSVGCSPVVETPLVLVAWQERANVLWGASPPADFWPVLATAVTSDEGWAAYGQPEWGYLKFGHTNPETSNSGLMTLLLMTYGYFDKTTGLTSQDILQENAYQEWLKSVEGTISPFGNSTGTYMADIVRYGPSTYDMVAVYEATAIEQLPNAANRYGELQVYYPPATVMSDHPFCVLTGEWVTAEQKMAAEVFISYLLSIEAQQAALLDHGFRPTNPAVSLTQPRSPLLLYADNGLSTAVPPEVEIPSGAVLSTLLDFWTRQGFDRN